MKIYTSILLFVTLLSCNHTYKQVATINYNDSSRVDSIYGRGNWSKYFKEWSSARGVTIKLRLINDSMYHIQWGKLPNLRELNFEFYLDGHVSWLPKYIAESNEYIVIRQSCGNPCWRGFFLPLIDSMPPIVINEYLDFDLTTYLVASIKASNLIEIKNLKTNKTEDHIINGCSSLFIGYCIDSLSIKEKTLKFK